MASILGVQSTLCSPSHPHPRPQKEPPPIPALPCCSSCCYPSLLLHFRESLPSFALFPIASPTASPLRQHHHHHHPPLPPRPRRYPTSSSSSLLLTRTSLLQTLLVPARKRPLSLPHRHPPPPLSPHRGASHPSFLPQKSPLTEHNNPTPTARPLGLLCARCAPILHISVPPPPRPPRLTAVSRQFRNLIDRQSLAPQEIRQSTPSTTTTHLPNSIPLSSCCRTHPRKAAIWPLASANTAARTRRPRPGRRSTSPRCPTFPTSDRRAPPTDGVSASTSVPVFFPRHAWRPRCESPSPW